MLSAVAPTQAAGSALTPSGPIAINGQNGTVVTGLQITSASGDCVSISNSTNITIKNSEIGAGSKVPHLSYIGDASVGEDTNLGASTVTANYDGARKHRTTIGARVKTSVDTTFVAPVTVGDDAYTAAGSVITKDVPAGALGVARARQENIEGYAKRRKERDSD